MAPRSVAVDAAGCSVAARILASVARTIVADIAAARFAVGCNNSAALVGGSKFVVDLADVVDLSRFDRSTAFAAVQYAAAAAEALVVPVTVVGILVVVETIGVAFLVVLPGIVGTHAAVAAAVGAVVVAIPGVVASPVAAVAAAAVVAVVGYSLGLRAFHLL